jgi:hypothetical protein
MDTETIQTKNTNQEVERKKLNKQQQIKSLTSTKDLQNQIA